MSIRRLYVEKKESYRSHADKLKSDVKNVLGILAGQVRFILRYDVENLDDKFWAAAKNNVFSEPPVDYVYECDELELKSGERIFGVEFLPGQYDQRADSAAQCVQLLTLESRPLIRCAAMYVIKNVSDEEFIRIKNYLINPVEARECSLSKPKTLKQVLSAPEKVGKVDGFISFSKAEIESYHKNGGFAMTVADLAFVQEYFKKEGRDPFVTEIKVIDTYWSDHCRHTTFLTQLNKITINSDVPEVKAAYEQYLKLFEKHYKNRTDKYPCLMDMATMGAREIKARGYLKNLDESDEINACSVEVRAVVDGKEEDWLVMFKNETHNHPTEIEPFGGAATCLGGAIRDPLSGRVYVYQAMRITGAADVNASFSDTLKGKLPQRVISKTAAAGFASYGNQIGLATGIVNEIYQSGYAAKRLETGFVVGAARKENVVRLKPLPGDAVILIGGATGRDGCGGATGSSKAHTYESIDTCGAEVQKGNPLTERKIQRLFRNKECTNLIKKCNDFGAGGVCVAIGELSEALDIDLDAVPKKYQGLSATELAISESQERMAVVVAAEDADKMIRLCADENLDATVVARITDTKRMKMFCGGETVVDIAREFLDTNGVRISAQAEINEKRASYFEALKPEIEAAVGAGDYSLAIKKSLSLYNVASQKGLSEMFDSTIGAGTVLMPFGGKYQLTPALAMAAKLPVTNGVTETATVASWGYNPDLMSEAQFTGAAYSVLLSVMKAAAAGAPLSSIRLTFQEFFERLRSDPKRWGKPAAALLGALEAQLGLNLAAIGGKDSMSGSFEDIDVPPTLISFALGIADAGNIISNEFKTAGEKAYRIKLKKSEANIPDYKFVTELLNKLNTLINKKVIKTAIVVEEGGAASAIIKSCFGNMLGFEFDHISRDLFTPSLCDLIVTLSEPDALKDFSPELMGTVISTPEVAFEAASSGSAKSPKMSKLALEDALKAFTDVFKKVYPPEAAAEGEVLPLSYKAKSIIISKNKTAKPKVFIPVFPGTNCEYDTAKRFILAGAEPEIFVIKNRSALDIEQSADAMKKIIDSSQIIAFPGGFSGGDEPDGSGKFIATTFRGKKLADAVSSLLYKRDGLAIGICNGFQALIKLGLLPYGEIKELTENSPTLTFNNISRHVSTVSYIKVASNLSPWFNNVKTGDVFAVAISHGEGKLVAKDSDIKRLIDAGQVATQYVDMTGKPTMQSPYNPNGSFYAIEGITSPDGRVLGKMGHSERIGTNIMKNIEIQSDMKIFEAGTAYFK